MLEMPDGSSMSPVWLGVMMAVNLQTSFLTPPFGFALFYLRGIAPDTITTRDIYRGVAPFILMQAIALIIILVFPQIVSYLPSLAK
jgi:TRAP-type mannitol/chloroaromatic compound transport system permease large subunit